MNYDGTWKIVKDTITFYWQYKWKQNADTLITKTNSSRQDISLSFQYDDGEPIPNVEASYTCGFEEDRKKYTSDQNGKIIIPWAEGVDFKKAACTERWLSYSMDNKYVYLGSNSLQDTLTNDFTVIIRKKTKSGVIKFAKKYLIAGDSLVEIAPPDNYSRWGNFKFFSVKYQL